MHPSPASAAPIRVAIVDDMPEFRLLLRLALEMDERFVVAGEAADGQQGLALVDEVDPDLLLLDLAMPVMDGLEVLDALAAKRAEGQRPRVLILSAFTESDAWPTAMRRGAHGYIEKGAQVRQIADIVVDRMSAAA